MAEKKGKVIFRRVNGRVIPIRIKQNQLEGLGLAAGGVAVGASGAAGAAALVKASASVRQKAKKQFRLVRALEASLKRSTGLGGQLTLGLDNPSAKNFKREALKNRAFSKTLFKMRNPLLAASGLAASNLLAEGYLRATERKESGVESAATQTIAGVAALGVSSLYYRKLGLKGLRNLTHTLARTGKRARPSMIPIKGVQGELKF